MILFIKLMLLVDIKFIQVIGTLNKAENLDVFKSFCHLTTLQFLLIVKIHMIPQLIVIYDVAITIEEKNPLKLLYWVLKNVNFFTRKA